MHLPSFRGALLASATASYGEEILCRLFLLSAILRLLPDSRVSVALAVKFGALHAPAACSNLAGFATSRPCSGSGWSPSTRSWAPPVACGTFARGSAPRFSHPLAPTW